MFIIIARRTFPVNKNDILCFISALSRKFPTIRLIKESIRDGIDIDAFTGKYTSAVIKK